MTLSRIAYRNRPIYLLLALPWLLLSTPGAAEQVVGQGVFAGTSGHTTSGSVRIVKTAAGFSSVLGPDFFLDGAPDPKVGFGKANPLYRIPHPGGYRMHYPQMVKAKFVFQSIYRFLPDQSRR